MTPEQVREWFDRIVDLAPEEREAELRRMAAEDEQAASELADLLSYVNGEDLQIERNWTPGPGLELGPYRLRRQIGSGGFGEVYRAVRIYAPDSGPVAVKILTRLADPVSRERFQRERQLLARLDHPNVARILDGGTTPGGAPYLVMEYVTGRPIDAYCDKRRLSIEQRLRVFDQVCGAVEHAHSRQILHRDLKPGNILVTPRGVVKLLDFGIAKITEPGALETTRPGEQAFTLSHASPEQISGKRLTTATDVYSLGVVLYQLLAGRLPFPAEPEMPSRIKDLNAVVLKALANNPEARYASVEALRNDVQRYREGFPVEARRPSVWHRTAKAISRHPAFSAFVASCLLCASYGAVRSGIEFSELKRQRARETRAVRIAGVLASDALFRLHSSVPEGQILIMINDLLRRLDRLSPEDLGSLEDEVASGFLRLAELEKPRSAIETADRAVERAGKLHARSPRFRRMYLKALELRAGLHAAAGDLERARADEAQIMTLKLQNGSK